MCMPGSVTSSRASPSERSISARLRISLNAAIRLSTSLLSSLIRRPMTGRSSLGTSRMRRMISVSSPVRPSTRTRTFSICASVAPSPSSASARERISSSCSLIALTAIAPESMFSQTKDHVERATWSRMLPAARDAACEDKLRRRLPRCRARSWPRSPIRRTVARVRLRAPPTACGRDRFRPP